MHMSSNIICILQTSWVVFGWYGVYIILYIPNNIIDIKINWPLLIAHMGAPKKNMENTQNIFLVLEGVFKNSPHTFPLFFFCFIDVNVVFFGYFGFHIMYSRGLASNRTLTLADNH